MRENYYILLELRFEPPENDKDRIERAIEAKRVQWSDICRNAPPSKARKAEAYLEMLPEIKSIMADDGKRTQEAQQAIEITRQKEKEKFEKIDDALKLVTLDGRISEEEIKELSRVLSVDEKVIRERIKVPIVKTKVVEKLEPSIYRQITDNLEIIGEKSLYDFLGVTAETGIEDIQSKTKKLDADLKTGSKKDSKQTAKQGLIGHCINLFKTEEMKRRYDATLAYQSLEELNKYLDIAGINGMISAEKFKILMEKAAAIGIETEAAEKYIFAYSKKKEWQVSTNTQTPKQTLKKCPHCGQLNPPEAKKCSVCNGPYEVICPKCSRRTPAANTSCRNCGFPIAGMSRALPLLKEAKQARDEGDLEKAAALFNRVLYFWPNHTETLTLLQEIEAGQTKMTQLTRQLNAGNPLKLPGISKILMGMAGIVLSFISLVPLSKIIVNLIKDKAYTGSEPYLAAAIATLIICTAISAWGIKNLLTGNKDIKGICIPVSRQFEVYGQVENEMAQKQEKPKPTAMEHFLKKDKIFIIGYFVFMGLVVMFFIAKAILPDEFFWNLRLTPGHFSFPFDITIPVTAAAVLRWASLNNHHREKNREMGKTDGPAPISITCKAGPDTFAPGIKEKLALNQADWKTNLAYYTGLSPSRGSMSKNGRIQGKLFIETHPEPVNNVRPVFINLYLSLAVILTGTGILYMTRVPPDNISVLTVPAIAMGYIWSIIKGGILLYSGTNLLAAVTGLTRVRRYQSVMVYVEITGEKDRNVYEFNVFTASLWTEMKTANGNRQIIKMTAEQESEKAKKMVTDAIESFE